MKLGWKFKGAVVLILFVHRPVLVEAGSLSRQEVKNLATAVKSFGDHQAAAQHYRLEAARLDAEARRFARLADIQSRAPMGIETKRPLAPMTAGHSRRFARHYRKRAEEAQRLARLHESLARRAD